jgi:hypothetical protein
MDNEFARAALVDLYDNEIKKCGEVWTEVMRRFSHKANTQHNLNEMVNWATDAYFKAGFIVQFDLSGALLGQPPTLTVIGRVDGLDEFDHDKKGWEAKKSKITNELYLGQKE